MRPSSHKKRCRLQAEKSTWGFSKDIEYFQKKILLSLAIPTEGFFSRMSRVPTWEDTWMTRQATRRIYFPVVTVDSPLINIETV